MYVDWGPVSRIGFLRLLTMIAPPCIVCGRAHPTFVSDSYFQRTMVKESLSERQILSLGHQVRVKS